MDDLTPEEQEEILGARLEFKAARKDEKLRELLLERELLKIGFS